MKLKNRIVTSLLAITLLAGAGVAAAAPAQAGTWGYSVSVQGYTSCKSMLMSAIRGKLNTGYSVYLEKPCYHSGGGYYSAYFTYSN
jgi:hypothetical protein